MVVESKISVAIYLRKSRSDEGLDALKNHKAVLTRLAEQNNFEYEFYEEIGSSISLDAREKMNELLGNIYLYSYVLVMDLDRLARSMVVMEEIKTILRYHDVQIMTPQQTIDLNNESNEMLMDFQSVIAKAEYQQIRKRLMLGKIEGARRGHWVNGVAPIGYIYDKTIKKLKINEVEFPLVREIYQMALKNMSYREIAINLNLRGFRTRKGNHFSDSSIKAILINRAYVGDVVYRQKTKTKGGQDEVIVAHNAHTPILTEADWLEVQRLIQSRRTNIGKVTTVVKSMVQGLLYCGCCGAKLSINLSSKKEGRSEMFVKGCWRVNEFGEHCPNKSVKLAPVVEAVIDELTSYKDETIEKVRELLSNDSTGLKQDLTSKIEYFKDEVSRQEDILTRLLDSYLENIIDKETYTSKKAEKDNAIKLLKQDIRRLELQIESLDSDRQVEKLKEVIRILENFESLDVQEANRFLMMFIKKITITSLADTASVYRKAKKEPKIEILLSE